MRLHRLLLVLLAAVAGAEEIYHLAAMISVPESVAKPAEC